MPIYSRTPVATAQIAATLDEFSGGRAVIGLGVSHRPVVEGWYGQKIDKPVAEMREYVGRPSARSSAARTRPPRRALDDRLPLHGLRAAARPADLHRRALPLDAAPRRRIADGVMLWLCNADYIRDVVVPEVPSGRERAGKPLEGFDIVAAVPCGASPTTPPRSASACARSSIPYFSLPFYRAMLERSGYEADIAAFDEKGPEGIGDDFIGDLAGIGEPGDIRATIEAYFAAGATSPCVGGIGGADFDGTLDAAAELI